MAVSVLPFHISILQFSQHRGAQGRLVRHLVLIVLWSLIAAICYGVYGAVDEYWGALFAAISVAIVAITFGWVAYRLIHYPPVADFLIDVQIESSKVTWSNWYELRRTTIIVLAVMAAFSAFLFVCDISWQFVLRVLSVLRV